MLFATHTVCSTLLLMFMLWRLLCPERVVLELLLLLRLILTVLLLPQAPLLRLLRLLLALHLLRRPPLLLLAPLLLKPLPRSRALLL
jgi:hypothetical protein